MVKELNLDILTTFYTMQCPTIMHFIGFKQVAKTGNKTPSSPLGDMLYRALVLNGAFLIFLHP